MRAASAVVPITGTPWIVSPRFRASSVHEAGRAQTRLGVLDELLDDRPAEPSRADDQDLANTDAVPPGLLEIPADRRPAREDEENVEPEEEHEHEPRVGEAARERRDTGQEQRGETRRDEDREALLHAGVVTADLIEPSRSNRRPARAPP
jgi:hypothetical protein